MSPLWGPHRVATPLCRNFGLVEPTPGAKPANVVAEYTLLDIFAGLGDLAARRAIKERGSNT